MNTVDIYNKAKNPPSDKEKLDQQNLQIKRDLAESEEASRRYEWNNNPQTKKFFDTLAVLVTMLDEQVRDLSSNPEQFSKVGYRKSFEAKILKKVINYGQTGNYGHE